MAQRAGKGGAPGRGGRKGGPPHASPPGPPSRPPAGTGASRRSQAGTSPHTGQTGASRRGTTSPAGTPPGPGQAGDSAHRPGQAGDTARRPGQAGEATPRQGSAPRRPETWPARPAPEYTSLSPAEDAAAYDGETRAKRRISRRALIQASLIGGAGVAALPLLALVGSISPSNEPMPTNLSYSLNSNWLFGGQYMAGSESSFYDDSGFAPVTVPHAVTPLSWRYWNPSAWQQLWIYRRHFNGGPLVNRDMSAAEQRVLPEDLVVPVADLIGSFGLDTWVHRGPD